LKKGDNMKIWKKENGNIVIEFEKEQDEMIRFSYVLGTGARHYRENARTIYDADVVHKKAAISAYMTKVMLDTYLVGTNYTQDFGTEDMPKHYHIKDFIKNALSGFQHFNTDRWLGEEIAVMRDYDWEELL